MNRTAQSIVAAICLSAALMFAWWVFDHVYWMLRLPPVVKISDLGESVKIKEDRPVSLSPVLEHGFDERGGLLKLNEIEKLTNQERVLAGGVALKRNELLDQAAQMKLEEMFQRQYFAHDSPDGKRVDSLATKAGYEFILIGENLALGNFNNEKALVDGWMGSPGHRQNILDPRYREIGLAARSGQFKGNNVWLAVQVFGLPLSFCPSPREDIKTAIQENKNLMEETYQELKKLQSDLTGLWPGRGEEYHQLSEHYNNLVQSYNQMIEESRELINIYNQEVAAYNQCIGDL